MFKTILLVSFFILIFNIKCKKKVDISNGNINIIDNKIKTLLKIKNIKKIF